MDGRIYMCAKMARHPSFFPLLITHNTTNATHPRITGQAPFLQTLKQAQPLLHPPMPPIRVQERADSDARGLHMRLGHACGEEGCGAGEVAGLWWWMGSGVG